MTRPQIASARTPQAPTLQAVQTTSGGFDIDLYHVMEAEDDALVADEVLNGSLSGSFIYSFSQNNSTVTGISVIGAAHLARQYGGLKHRLVASIEKRGSLHIFCSYPGDGDPMRVTTSTLYDLADDEDYYKVLIEIEDIKTGNRYQSEKMESRTASRKGGGTFEREHFQQIAQSKAYRNAVLRLVPQDVQNQFKGACLAQGKSKDISASAIDAKRNGVLTYAAKHGIPVDRDEVFNLSWAQISGLSEAASTGLPAFTNSARALGILVEQQADTPAQQITQTVTPTMPAAEQQRQASAAPAPEQSAPKPAAKAQTAAPAKPADEPPPPPADDFFQE